MGMQLYLENELVIHHSSVGPAGIYKSTNLSAWDFTSLPPAKK